MRTTAALAWNTFQESLRSRYWLLCLVFAAVLLYVSLLLGLLAADQEVRVVLDFGLSLIELMALAAAAYGAATTLLREIETKTVYLILTRPVGRGRYLLGRFAGLALSTTASVLIMACVHLTVLALKKGLPVPHYAAAILAILLKVLMAAALTLFLALFSSSVLTAVVIALIVWSLGHVLPEIRFMIKWNAGTHGLTMAPLMALSYLIPDLQLLNLRDRLSSGAPLLGPAAYALAYAAGWLSMAVWRLRRREF